ncbi:hypothetical protein V6N12_031476 [Hibiscus sabdariffa]|uniref:Uncharacterized protein n=1 Tax=Hibiscus sabdariffa TaxID=183260 RepID=A0ABR2CPC5_9ROSI
MAEVGLDGFELQRFAGSMVLLAFPDLEKRGNFVLAMSDWSIWFDSWCSGLSRYSMSHVEAELVHVPAVEEREIDSGSEEGDSVQHGGSVVSPASHESRYMNQG